MVLTAGLGALARARGRKAAGTMRHKPFEERSGRKTPPVRGIEVVRAAWGLALLMAPSQVLRALGERRDRMAKAVARLLGARQPGWASVPARQCSPGAL